jgi:hypothetical protein
MLWTLVDTETTDDEAYASLSRDHSTPAKASDNLMVSPLSGVTRANNWHKLLSTWGTFPAIPLPFPPNAPTIPRACVPCQTASGAYQRSLVPKPVPSQLPTDNLQGLSS